MKKSVKKIVIVLQPFITAASEKGKLSPIKYINKIYCPNNIISVSYETKTGED